MAERTGWTRDQLLIALRLYMRMPFGRLHGRNPEIIELAGKIGRTPNALAMKACNFASIDPVFRATNRKGLSGASEADRAVWREFRGNTESLAAQAEEAFSRIEPVQASEEIAEIQPPRGATEGESIVRVRRVQSFFRAAVLTSYDNKCALTGLNLPELLNASHIIPWKKSVERRADPRNGICFNALLDRAFDRGLFSFDDEMRVVVSPRWRKIRTDVAERLDLAHLEGRPLRPPKRFAPDLEAIRFHRDFWYTTAQSQ
jgi:hypothetical protein